MGDDWDQITVWVWLTRYAPEVRDAIPSGAGWPTIIEVLRQRCGATLSLSAPAPTALELQAALRVIERTAGQHILGT